MPMGWVALATGAAGVLGADASSSAAKMQADAANNASAGTMAMFQQNKADLAPWATAGKTGLNALLGLMGLPGGTDPGAGGGPGSPTTGAGVTPFGNDQFALFKDPSYQWRLGQGQDALLNKASALGGVAGGNTLKALTDYSQGAASQEWGSAQSRWDQLINNIFSRLSGISGTGANAAGMTANLGTTAAGQTGENMIGAGNALAAGRVGSANALTGAASGIGNNYLLSQIMQNQQQRPPAGGWGADPWFTDNVAGGLVTE